MSQKPLIALDEDESGLTTVHVSQTFIMMNSLQKADLLSEWSEKLEEMYEEITDEDTFLTDMAPKKFNEGQLN